MMPLVAKRLKHRIDLLGWQRRSAVEPPGQYSHVGAHDILDDKFARDDAPRVLVDSCGKLVAHQIGNYLANGAKGNGAATAASQMSLMVIAS